jgi:hypothetical protein
LDTARIFEVGESSIKPITLSAKIVTALYMLIVSFVLIRTLIEVLRVHRHPKAVLQEYMEGMGYF